MSQFFHIPNKANNAVGFKTRYYLLLGLIFPEFNHFLVIYTFLNFQQRSHSHW
jgi:hypothetical protein